MISQSPSANLYSIKLLAVPSGCSAVNIITVCCLKYFNTADVSRDTLVYVPMLLQWLLGSQNACCIIVNSTKLDWELWCRPSKRGRALPCVVLKIAMLISVQYVKMWWNERSLLNTKNYLSLEGSFCEQLAHPGRNHKVVYSRIFRQMLPQTKICGVFSFYLTMEQYESLWWRLFLKSSQVILEYCVVGALL